MKSIRLLFLAIFSMAVFIISCKKKEIPIVETSSLTSITNNSAISGGSIISDGDDGIIKRGVCWAMNPDPTIDDNKTSDGNGSGNFTSTIKNLEPGTNYYVKAFATNGTGTGYGTTIAFKTLGQVPNADLSPATNIATTSASLSATINPNYVSTTVTFEFGTTTTYGSSASAIESPVNGSSNVSVSATLADLTPGTIYHYRVKAENSLGITYSPDQTFTTLGLAPTATTPVISNITTSSAKVSATVNANYLSTIVSFEYGTTTSYGNSIPANISPVTGNVGVAVNANITSLAPAILYHVRVKTENSLGVTYSSDITFTTLGQAPSASNPTIGYFTTSSATVSATVNAHYLSTVVSFEYGTTTSYGNAISAYNSPVTGNANVTVGAQITSLAPGTLYHLRVKAENSLGITYSGDITLKTLGQLPTVFTGSVSSITWNSAILTGTINPMYLNTIGSFEYGKTTSYGNSVPISPITVYGSSDVSETVAITGLEPGTLYHVRITATNALGTSNGVDITFTTIVAPTSNVTDIEGNVYPVLTLGSQIWMGENLKTTKYNDNTDIPNVTDGATWIALTSPGFCWYNNDDTYKDTYGALYNFYAVSTHKLCPTGWHVPSDAEFTVFTNFLGYIDLAGGKIKEAGTLHWTSPNTGANNATGFTALPAGYRTDAGSFDGVGRYEVWWTSTPSDEFKPWYRSVGYLTSAVEVRNGSLNQRGFSVRCIKD